MAHTVRAEAETWPLDGVFRISRGARTETDVVLVEISADGVTGRGEASPSSRYDETAATVVATVAAVKTDLERALDLSELARRLPASSARNAIDCALWDLKAKLGKCTVAQLAQLPEPGPLTTAFTLSIDDPARMGMTAATHADRELLKLKLAGDGLDLERVAAVRAHAPRTELIVDANEAWSVADYERLVPKFEALRVAMIEQPFPAADDAALADLARPIPVCADESCHTREDLDRLVGRYDIVNVKLDKTGGLTEALALAEQAAAAGLGLMVGCMLGTSLAMAPAMLVAQKARYVDLDGPLLLARDREPGLRYHGSQVYPCGPELWG